jgi:hypothetical protein
LSFTHRAPRVAEIDIHEDRKRGDQLEVIEGRARDLAARKQAAVVEQRKAAGNDQLSSALAVDVVVGLLGEDVKGRLAVLQVDPDDSCGVNGVTLHARRVHAPRLHRGNHLVTRFVGPHPGDHQRLQTEGLQVPGNVEGRSTEHPRPLGHHVEEHLADDERPPFVVHPSLQSAIPTRTF